MAVPDRLGRPLRDLRISVTDRCNFRCRYCLPREMFQNGHVFLPRRELLTFEEIERLARRFVSLGVRRIRLSGGEPLLRRNIERLVERLVALEGLEDLSITTNGSLLARKARALREAGLRRVTVSLDALDEASFAGITDASGRLGSVLDGIQAALDAGLRPVKINMVVRRGVNEHCVLPMVRWFRRTGCIVRFIEYMDVGTANGWCLDDVVPAREIVRWIAREVPLEPLEPAHRGEVAERWRYADGSGEIGVIGSVTQPFCRDCTRMRLSADGKLYTCLFASQGTDLRGILRNGASERDLDRMILGNWIARDDRYSELRSSLAAGRARVEMSYIGG